AIRTVRGENFGRPPALFGMRREAHGRKSLRSRALQWRCEAFASMRKSDYPHSSSLGGTLSRGPPSWCALSSCPSWQRCSPLVREAAEWRTLFPPGQIRRPTRQRSTARARPKSKAAVRSRRSSALPLRPSRNKSQRNPRLKTLPKSSVPAHTGEIVPKAALRRHRRRRHLRQADLAHHLEQAIRVGLQELRELRPVEVGDLASGLHEARDHGLVLHEGADRVAQNARHVRGRLRRRKYA